MHDRRQPAASVNACASSIRTDTNCETPSSGMVTPCSVFAAAIEVLLCVTMINWVVCENSLSTRRKRSTLESSSGASYLHVQC